MNSRCDSVRSFIIDQLTSRAESEGIAVTTELTGDTDLLATGLIDSLGFVELIASIEVRFSCQVDFSSRFAEDFTTLDGLVSAVTRA